MPRWHRSLTEMKRGEYTAIQASLGQFRVTWLLHWVMWLFHRVTWLFHWVKRLLHWVMWLLHRVTWLFHRIAWPFSGSVTWQFTGSHDHFTGSCDFFTRSCDFLWWYYRFFCPPPTLYLSGKGWEDRRKQLEGKKSEGKGPVHRPCAFIGIGNSEQEMQQLSLEDKVGMGQCGVQCA